jgi:hypothetical protein
MARDACSQRGAVHRDWQRRDRHDGRTRPLRRCDHEHVVSSQDRIPCGIRTRVVELCGPIQLLSSAKRRAGMLLGFRANLRLFGSGRSRDALGVCGGEGIRTIAGCCKQRS